MKLKEHNISVKIPVNEMCFSETSDYMCPFLDEERDYCHRYRKILDGFYTGSGETDYNGELTVEMIGLYRCDQCVAEFGIE